ncbi:MAG: hypothetical protein EOL89_11810 [Actinobacteria bacterium]|nr:hypothetical protein [Actinomycetota bacterium]
MNNPAVPREAQATLAASSLAVGLAFLLGPVGSLMAKFGLSYGAASMIIGVLSSSGGYLVAAMWPFLLPWIATMRGLLAVAGTGFVIGW